MRILFVDDDATVRKTVRRLLAPLPDLELYDAATYEEAIGVAGAEAFDLFLVDIRLSERPLQREGLALVRELRKRGVTTQCVMVTSSSQLDDLREAMRAGANDYVLKDELSSELLLPVVEGVRQRTALEREVKRLHRAAEERWGVAALVGTSPVMDKVRSVISRVADSDVTVLVRGETGTGKELVARALHQESERRNEPFVAINCAAMPPSLAESILFGHERGAFTGADRRRQGRFQAAGKGTLLLDEIGDLPLELQAKLLRVLEDRTCLPVGAQAEERVHARIVAATNAGLERRIADGRFRQDLFYRLDIVSIDLPSLSARGDDIYELIDAFCAETKPAVRLTEEARRWCAERVWRGNVRELRNAIRRLALLAETTEIDQPTAVRIVAGVHDDSSKTLSRLAAEVLALPEELGAKLAAIEAEVLRLTLERTGGNKSAAARLLGVERRVLSRRWNRFGGDQDETEDE